MKQINQKLREAHAKFRALSSLNQTEYEELLPVFDELVSKKMMYFTLKGTPRVKKRFKEASNSSLPGSRAKLDFMLMYLKENPNQSYHGCMFEMCQAKVSEWVNFLSPLLEEALKKLGYMPQTGDTYKQSGQVKQACLLADVTEREVPRRCCYQAQREEYSGKKRRHTIKNFALTDTRGYVLFLSDTYEGSMHDKTIWDQLYMNMHAGNLLADLGFLGAEKACPQLILPYKKPKGGELDKLQKQINQAISRTRVRIEHAFSGIKRLKIIRNKIRLKSYNARERVIRIAAGLHNLRITFRKPLLNQS